MKPYQAARIHALALFALGIWEYTQTRNLIPIAFAVLFGAASFFSKRGNSIIGYVMAALALFLLIALVMPFQQAMKNMDGWAAVRAGGMILFTAFACIVYIRHYLKKKSLR